jgi:tetratricopeptide (TPR) repeat protein
LKTSHNRGSTAKYPPTVNNTHLSTSELPHLPNPAKDQFAASQLCIRMTSNTQCDKLRGEGNLLYKMGRLDEGILPYSVFAMLASSNTFLAIKKYQEAAKHGDPQESAPLRNLSAAYYEIGNYRKCITAAEQALKLIEKVAEEDIPLQKEKLQKRIKKAKDHFQRPPIEEKTHRRIKIMKMVERYKPSL